MLTAGSSTKPSLLSIRPYSFFPVLSLSSPGQTFVAPVVNDRLRAGKGEKDFIAGPEKREKGLSD